MLEYALGPLGLPGALAEVEECDTALDRSHRTPRHDPVRRGTRRARPDDPLPPGSEHRMACASQQKSSRRTATVKQDDWTRELGPELCFRNLLSVLK